MKGEPTGAQSKFFETRNGIHQQRAREGFNWIHELWRQLSHGEQVLAEARTVGAGHVTVRCSRGDVGMKTANRLLQMPFLKLLKTT